MTHHHCKNKGENSEEPLITILDHHEGIVSRELWESVQKELARRSSLIPEKRKYSGTYWFSSKVKCGKCGKPFNVSGGHKDKRRKLRCTNRAVYGKDIVIDANGGIRGCDNKTVSEAVLAFGVKHILQYIQVSQSEIEKELLEEIQIIQKSQPELNVPEFQENIEKLKQKKRDAID